MWINNQAVSRESYPSEHSSWWRRLEDVLKTSFVFVFRRRLQDMLIKTNLLTLLIRLQKMSLRRLQDVLIKTNIFVLAIRLQDLFKTFSKRLQEVFKTSLRRLAKTSSRHLQDVFKTLAKTSSRHLQGVLKTIWIRLQDVLQRNLQDNFKPYHPVGLFA